MASIKLFRVVGIVLGMSAIVAVWNIDVRAEVLFQDTFDNSNVASYYSSTDYGLNDELSSRQSGTDAGIQYLRQGAFANSAAYSQINKDGNGMLCADLPSAGSAGALVLDHNFTPNVKVSATLFPANIVTDAAGWVGFAVRGSDNSPDLFYGNIPLAGDVGAVLFIRTNGTWLYWENGENVLNGNVSYTTSVDIVMETNGSTMNAWLGGTQIITNRTMTGAGATRTNNYISIGANSPVSYVDNLTIESIPEPSAIIMLSIGMTGLLAYAWRKRK